MEQITPPDEDTLAAIHDVILAAYRDERVRRISFSNRAFEAVVDGARAVRGMLPLRAGRMEITVVTSSSPSARIHS